MKILVITDLYPVKDNEKHTSAAIKNFVCGWMKSGHEVSVIRPNFIFNSFLRGKSFYKSGIYGDIENINYFFPFAGNVKNKITSPLDTGFDIVIAHMPSGVIFANKLGLPFTAGIHVSDLEVLTNPLYSVYFKRELENAHKNALKIACRSEVLKNKFLKLYPQYENKTFVCFSGIDFIPVRRKWRTESRVKVLTCANLIKRKNIDKVIKECETLNVDLKIIGSGREFRRLRNLSDKSVFAGSMAHNEVLEEMKKSDIFVLPSVNETFGLVYLEAMGSGCITVCTENDGISGIIKDGFNGYYWKSGIIERIIRSSNQNEILDNTYETILNFTAEKACENYLNCIFAK